MVDRAGRQLGNYRLLSLLGQGGFAEVYLGEHVFLKKAVAVKVLYTQLGKNDLEGFLREAQTIAHLEHPHIVRVTDFGLDGELPYLVMEYAPNGTLRQRHPRNTTLPLTTISAYVKQIAAALQYAHDEKLVHRDIKPENMLLNRNNELLLSDFGVATVAYHTVTQNTQSIAGTAVYMAPELFQGKSYAASDQYALGIVVYEWLSGQPPFNIGDFIQLGFLHTYMPPESLSEKNPAMPKDVEQVVMTALAKDPKQRFGSVKAFANALEQACMAAAATQKEKEAAPPSVLSVQAKEVTQLPRVQSQSAPLSPVPVSAVQEISPSQPTLTPNQDTPPTSTPVVSMQGAASDNQLDSQNQSIPSVATETVEVKRQPLATGDYMSPLSTPMNSTQYPSQPEGKKRVVVNHAALAEPKRTVSRRSVIIGLGITGLVIIVAALGGIALWTIHPTPTVISVTPTVISVTPTIPRTLTGYSYYTQGQPTIAGFQPTQWPNTTSCIFDKSYALNYHAISKTKHNYMRCMETRTQFKNFAMQVSISINGNVGGVIFRDNGHGTYYRLAFNPIFGTYSLYFCSSGVCDASAYDVGIVNSGKLLKSGSVAWGANKSITFTITMIVIDSNIDLYIGNVQIAHLSAIPFDANSNTYIPSSGYVGVYAGNLGNDTDVTFSNLKVWIIPDSATPPQQKITNVCKQGASDNAFLRLHDRLPALCLVSESVFYMPVR